jgi:energy-coupling factor transporter ATP-binding protein EcfA2
VQQSAGFRVFVSDTILRSRLFFLWSKEKKNLAHCYLIPITDNTLSKKNLYSLHEETTISYRKGLQFAFQVGDCALLSQQGKKAILPYEFQLIKVDLVQHVLLLKVKKIHKLPIPFAKAMHLLATPSNITDYRILTDDEFASLIKLMYDKEDAAFAATTLSSPLIWEEFSANPINSPLDAVGASQTEDCPLTPLQVYLKNTGTSQTEDRRLASVLAYLNSTGAPLSQDRRISPVQAYPNSTEAHQTEDHLLAPEPVSLESTEAHQTQDYLLASGLASLKSTEAYLAPGPTYPESTGAYQTEDHLLASVQAYLKSKGYYFEEETLKNYHICLKTKPFVILAGLSGTGKSKLAQLYAEALGSRKIFQRIPVEPNWTDSHDLLGHFNALTGEYETEPALDFLFESARDPDHLYFLCLDEMNLSHIEYYFAPFLSAMEEDQAEDRTIPLMSKSVYTRLQKEKRLSENIPFEITIPNQFYFIGTINIDETTRPLSDKVIDRANTIEFFDVNLDQLPTPHTPPSLQPISAQNWEHFKAKFPDLCYRPYLKEIDSILRQANFGLGYRIVREIEMYVANSKGLLDPLIAFDLQVKQRILPRIRGTDMPLLNSMIDELSSFVHKQRLVRTEKRLDEMKSRLKRDGYTSFWR